MATNAQVNFTIAAKNQASGAIAGVNKSLGGLKTKTLAVGTAIGTALGGLAVAGIAKLTSFIQGSIGAASNLAESMSKTKTIFADAADGVIAFAQTAGDNLGLSQQAALDAQSTFGIFAQSAGLSGKDLSDFSGNLTTLSADFASFYNTSPEQAITAVGAALRGESEPIRKYGILLNEAALKNRALQMGIIKNTKTALTPQQKVLAAQAEIMAQSSKAQGDFARTSGGLANQQRILSAAMENLSADLGTAFQPILAEVMGFITGTVIPTFRDKFVPIVEALKDGFTKLADVVKGVVGPIVDALQKPVGDLILKLRNLFNQLKPIIYRVAYELLVAFQKVGRFIGEHLAPAFVGLVALLNGPLGMAIKLLVGAFVGIKVALMAYNAVQSAFIALKAIGTTVTTAFTAAQALLNAVLALNPISLLVLGIAALIGMFIVAYASSEDFRKVMNGIFDAVTGVIGVIVGGLVGAFKLLVGVAETVGKLLMNSPLGVFFKLAMMVAEGIGGIIGAVFGGGSKAVTPTAPIGPGAVTFGTGGGGTNVNVYTTLDGADIATSVDTRIGSSLNSSRPRTRPGGN